MATEIKHCDVCGRGFKRQRSTARFCGGKCRQRASRARKRFADLEERGREDLDELTLEYEYLLAERNVRLVEASGGRRPGGSMGKRLEAAVRKREAAVNKLLKSYAFAPSD